MTDPVRASAAPKSATNDNGREILIWSLAFAIAAIWPVVWFAYPIGQDAPNHLARAFILLHPDDPLLSQHFEITWHAVPDLAWDVFAVLVGQVVDLVTTLKLFMLAGFGLTILGVALINRQIAGRWTWVPLLAVPFLFHTGYAKSFLAFNVTIGLSLVGIAIWMAGSERRWGRRLALGMVVSTVLFFSHLVGWGVYGLALLGFKLTELVRKWRANGARELAPWCARSLRDGTLALPPIVLLVLATLWRDQSIDLVGKIDGFQLPWERIVEAWRLIDVGTYVTSLPVLVIVTITLFAMLFSRRSVRFSFTVSVPIGLLVIAFFAVPGEIYNTAFVAWRIALGATLLAIASAVPVAPVSTPVTRAGLGLLLVMTLSLSGWQAWSISNAEIERRDFAALVENVPPGDTLFATHADLRTRDIEFDRIGLYHFGSDAVRSRKIMVQSLFSYPAQQPIRYREPQFDNPKTNSDVFVSYLDRNLVRDGVSLAERLSWFQWIAVHGPHPEADADIMPLAGFSLAAEQGNFRLYCRLDVCAQGVKPGSGGS